MKLSVIIPSLGFEPALQATISEVMSCLPDSYKRSTEVVVVFTPKKGSRKKDVVLFESLRKDFNGLVRVVEEPQPGYGTAYKTGFKNARGQFVLTLDADLTYPLDDLGRMLRAAEHHELDFINTNRLAGHIPEAFHWSHGIGNRLLAIIMNILFSTGFCDSMSGMWLITRSSIDRMRLQARHWPFSMEIKVEASLRGMKCAEIDIQYRPRTMGTSTISVLSGLKVAMFIFAKRFGLAGVLPM